MKAAEMGPLLLNPGQDGYSPHADQDQHARVLIYSHDTFGLGHLRRSRAIANALVAERPGVSVVIISGSPVIGNFEFGSGSTTCGCPAS